MQDALPAIVPQEAVQQDEPQNLFFRNDTIFGICEAIGQDFGVNSNYLRVVLCSLLYFNPVAVIGGYFALGAAVALSRWLYPAPSASGAPQVAAQPEAVVADNEDDTEALAA